MMVSVGHENFANSRFIIAILKPDSSPLKKLRRSAEDERMLINATSGRKARSLVVMNSNHIILSALQTETLKQRLNIDKSKGRLL
jgi:regulator of extracellular matrix RemA (YlzA/DUF370 family)